MGKAWRQEFEPAPAWRGKKGERAGGWDWLWGSESGPEDLDSVFRFCELAAVGATLLVNTLARRPVRLSV